MVLILLLQMCSLEIVEDFVEHLYLKNDKHNPFCTKGIVWCGHNIDKQKCLKIFMNYAEIRPTRIIFIDDNKKNLVKVQNFCKVNNIKFTGIAYSEAETITSGWPFSKETAEVQFEALKNKNIWLPEIEAVKFINAK